MTKLDPLPDLYLDMDGVLADFDTVAGKITGKDTSMATGTLLTPDDWKKIKADKNFWFDLPQMPNLHILWDFVKQFEPHILSAYTNEDKENGIRGKTSWIKKNLGNIPSSKIHLVERHEKQQFAVNKTTGKPNVLVDDYKKNIDEWRKAGGFPVHHVGVRSTIAKLKLLGYKKD